MTIFCIIPARGGSKGVPHKNITPFLGEPLISHSIKYALQSKLVDGVFVSTDDEQISEISKNFGAEVIPRPADISGDTATTESAISHAIQWWQDKAGNDAVFLDCRGWGNAKPFAEKYPDDWKSIPQDELKNRMDEVPRGKPLVLICNTGVRSYEAQLELKQKGITDTYNLQGGMATVKKWGLDL